MTHPDGQGLRAEGVSIASDFDIAIVGGLVFDGTGAEPAKADVGMVGDTITAVGLTALRRLGNLHWLQLS